MKAHNIWFYNGDWQHIYFFLTSIVSIVIISAVSAKVVHVAQPHCCWAVSEWSHVHLWASLQALHILRTAAVTCTCLVKEHQSGSCIVWICYPGKCTDPAAVSFRWCEAVSGHNSMLDCWCYIKHDASRPWSCLCYSGKLLFSPRKHLSSILNSRGKKDVSLMKARISPSCSVTAEDKEEACFVLLKAKRWCVPQYVDWRKPCWSEPQKEKQRSFLWLILS